MSPRSSARIRPLPRRLDSLSGSTGATSKSPAVKAPPKKIPGGVNDEGVFIKEESKLIPTSAPNVRDILARSAQVDRKIVTEPPRGRMGKMQVIRDDVCQDEMRLAHQVHVPTPDDMIYSSTGLDTTRRAGICPPLRLGRGSLTVTPPESGKSLVMIQMPRLLPPLSDRAGGLSLFSDVPDGRLGTYRIHASGRRSLLVGEVVYDVSATKRSDSSQTEFVCVCPNDGEAIFLGKESTSRLVVCPVID